MSQNTSITVINLARDAVTRIGRWQTVELTDRWIQVVPVEFATRLPPIGESGRRSAHHWLTLEFWIQDRATGLGMFWWVNPVIDLTTRNATLERLFADGRTGFVRNSVKDWRGLHEFAIAGQTISFDWWPKGGTPSLSSAATSIEAHITGWNQRLGAILAAIESAADTGHSSAAASTEPVPSELRPIQRRSPVKQSPAPARTTPPIPAKFRTFRAQPHYTSIFEIYPDETRIYGTEDWHGDWSARVLFMAKDAGSSRIFKPLANGGRGWNWVTNHARPTNRNLRPLIDSLPGGKLYGSFLGPLLRNDDRESGDLVIDESIRAFVQDLFQWTVSQMPNLDTVAVLGKDAWRELTLAIRMPDESARWKERHVSGRPLMATIGGRPLLLVALNHPARIVGSKLMQQPGWKWISQRYSL